MAENYSKITWGINKLINNKYYTVGITKEQLIRNIEYIKNIRIFKFHLKDHKLKMIFEYIFNSQFKNGNKKKILAFWNFILNITNQIKKKVQFA